MKRLFHSWLGRKPKPPPKFIIIAEGDFGLKLWALNFHPASGHSWGRFGPDTKVFDSAEAAHNYGPLPLLIGAIITVVRCDSKRDLR